jgi:hypothetical protein
MALGGVLLCPIIYFAESWPNWLIFAVSIISKLNFALGASALCLLNWRVFRPGRIWAASAFAAASAAMLAAIAMQTLRGDATTHWALLPENYVLWGVRTAAYAWTGFESLRYAGMMRRQARIGLGDPVVAAQIRLWGVAGTAIAAMLVFWALAPHLGHASVREWPSGMFAANALGLVAASSLHLAFMPPLAWRRWIEQRAAG